MEEEEKKHREHSKVNHPMTKDQLEGVWEDQVSLFVVLCKIKLMSKKLFETCIFISLHNILLEQSRLNFESISVF
jgi:hypothetical protein